MPSAGRFTVEKEGDISVITLTDPVVQETLRVTQLQDALMEFIEERAPSHVVVDFRHVKQCSTAVINGLLRIKNRLASSNGELRLCEMRPGIQEAFQTLNLIGSVFQVDPTRSESVTVLQGE